MKALGFAEGWFCYLFIRYGLTYEALQFSGLQIQITWSDMMATVLLVVIYLAYMSLGVPHSLIGAAWPMVCTEFSLSEWQLSVITFLISGFTVVSSLLSAKVLNRIGTKKTTAFSIGLTAIVMLLYSFSGNYFMMCLLAIPLGLGAGTIDAGLNNYIARHYKAYHMNFLHCFYGIGASVSPWLISLALNEGNWRTGYFYAFVFQGIIALLVFLSFPLWNKVKRNGEALEEAEETKTLTLLELAKSSKMRAAWIFMMTTNIIEYACGSWLCTYFVNVRGFEETKGALMISVFYIGMAVGRFLSGAVSKLVRTWKRIYICAGVTLVSILLMILPVGETIAISAVFLIGLGNGPIYPNFIYLIPYNFDRRFSQSIMGSVIASAFVGVMLSPLLFGAVSGLLGIDLFLWFLLGIFGVMLLSMLVFIKKMGKKLPTE